ncbi:MAG: monomethylamine:corrinoid methyltransferase, partial [Candidatus Thorarchaeota archaeon]
MISLLEVAERAQTGFKMGENEWNMGMFRKMKDLSEKYGLQVGEVEKVYEVDNAYADQLFEASLEYLSTMGVYCISTNRAIQFTEEEVKEACREAPDKITVGRNRDVRTIIQRRIKDTRPPSIIAGGHSAWNEELMPLENMIKELVNIPRIDFLETFNYHRIMGREVHGTPLVVYAARKATERARMGVSLAGRAGLALCYYPILTTAEAFIAAKDEERGLRSSDGLLLSVLPDLKVETGLLAASIYYEEYGCFRQNGGTGGSVGGFAGGWEGAMIEAVVRNIAAWMVYRDAIQYGGGVSRLQQSALSPQTGRMQRRSRKDERLGAWCSFAMRKALRRHKHTITVFSGGSGGLVEDQASVKNLLSTAISSIRGTVMGGNLRYVRTPPPTTVRWGIEVSDAALKSRVKLTDMDELFGRIRREKLQSFETSRDRRMLLYSDPHAFFSSHE